MCGFNLCHKRGLWNDKKEFYPYGPELFSIPFDRRTFTVEKITIKEANTKYIHTSTKEGLLCLLDSLPEFFVGLLCTSSTSRVNMMSYVG